jgi:hypothetical protein
MDFVTLLLFVGAAFCAFYAGYKYREARFLHDLLTSMKQMESHLSSALGSESEVTLKVLTVQDIKCEIIGNRYYFYASEDDTFICHGESLDEAAESYGKSTNNNFVARFTNPANNTIQHIINGRITTGTELSEDKTVTTFGEPGS